MKTLITVMNFVGPFIGVFVGWLLTRKNENDKIKYNEICQLKRSLYVLLEIRNQLAITKRFDKYIAIVVDKLNLIANELSQESIDPELFKEIFKQIIPSLIGENYQNDLQEQFSKSVDRLSEIDPLLAYRINGKQNIQEYLKSWENIALNSLESDDLKEIQIGFNHFKPKMIDEIRDDLDSIILDIAELIGKKEVKRVKNIITEPEDLEIEIDIESLLRRMFEGLILIPN